MPRSDVTVYQLDVETDLDQLLGETDLTPGTNISRYMGRNNLDGVLNIRYTHVGCLFPILCLTP